MLGLKTSLYTRKATLPLHVNNDNNVNDNLQLYHNLYNQNDHKNFDLFPKSIYTVWIQFLSSEKFPVTIHLAQVKVQWTYPMGLVGNATSCRYMQSLSTTKISLQAPCSDLELESAVFNLLRLDFC